MPTTDELKLSPFPSILIVGDAGTRKTWLAGQFPKPYFFDFDKGMATLRGTPGITYDTFKDAPEGSKVFDPAKGIYEWGRGWPAFIKKLNEIGATLDDGKCPYKTLVPDSLTMMGNLALNYVLREAKANGRYKSGDPVDQGLWGQQSRLLETTMDQLTAWDIVRIVTAHVQRDTNTITQNIEKLPLTTGKFAGKVGAYFDEVWYIEAKADKLVIKTKHNAQMRQAKSRYFVPDESELDFVKLQKVLFGVAATK